jgi:hypothetical protein
MTRSELQSLPAWIDRIGDWNPQLLRELKGRLQWRSVLLTVALVAIVQVLFMLSFVQRLPTELNISQYCLNTSPPTQNGVRCLIDWQRWWGDILGWLNWTIAFFIYLPAIYFLIADINQEVQRGTMNFLRLSPRSSESILLGKILGVPSLSYLTLLLAMPLHLLVGLMFGISPLFFLSYYGTFILFGAVLLSGALFLGFSSGTGGTPGSSKAVSGGVLLGLLSGIVLVSSLWSWNTFLLWQPYLAPLTDPAARSPNELLNWFFLTINQNAIVMHLFTWGNLAIVAATLWRILQRAYTNPKATLLSKRQSYFLAPYSVLLLLGFAFQRKTGYSPMPMIGFIQLLIPWGLIGLITTLSTPRQTWLDWIRYRQSATESSGLPMLQPTSMPSLKPSLKPSRSIDDLIWGEKSPGLTAIGINLLMVTGIIATALAFSDANGRFAESAIGWWGILFTVTLVTIYALLTQWMLMLKTQKRSAWALGSLVLAIGLPSIIGGLFTSFSISVGEISQLGKVMLLCSPCFRGALFMDQRLDEQYAGNTEAAMIALVIQSIVILFLISRVWSEWRSMSRS